MSQIHPEYKSLEELVDFSTYILIVEKSDPFMTHELISRYDGIKLKPPYKSTVFHFKVIEKLHSIYKEDLLIKEGKEISVFSGNTDTALSVHASYVKDGTMKSPFYQYYESSIKFDETDKMIIFIYRKNGNELEFSADSSFESPEKRKEIEELIKKKKDKQVGYENIDPLESEPEEEGGWKSFLKFFR